MKEEQNSKMREHMLDYLVSLLDDVQDFSWGVAKASHVVLLCRMEQGEIIVVWTKLIKFEGPLSRDMVAP